MADRQWVPALKLSALDPSLQRWGMGLFGRLSASTFASLWTDIDQASVRGGVVIPLKHTRRQGDVLVEVSLRNPTAWQRGNLVPRMPAGDLFSKAGGIASVPVSVLFRNRQGQLSVLGLGTLLSEFSQYPGGSFATPAVSMGGRAAENPRYYDPLRWLVLTARLSARTHLITVTDSDNGDAILQGFDLSAQELSLIEGIVISADQQLMISELRLWEGDESTDLNLHRDRRLDGREPGLIGYWKFDEGQGTQIADRSRYGRHGVLNGGEWVAASGGGSGLALDLERQQLRSDFQQRRTAMFQNAQAYRSLLEDLEKLNQERTRLNSRIAQLTEQSKALATERTTNDKQNAALTNDLNASFTAWQKDIDDGGKVAVGTFSNGIALELDRVNQRMTAAQTPYALQDVALQIRALPVAETGGAGVRLRFPSLEDQKIQSDQLSTLKLNFALRGENAARALSAIPDVQDCTEALAKRILGSAGFRVDVAAQVVDRSEDIGRVVSQVPSANILAEPDKIVRIFIGQMTGNISLPRGV